MRSLLAGVVVLAASTAVAQQTSGTWTGYVNGWVSTPATTVRFPVRSYPVEQQYNPYWAAQAIAAQQIVYQQSIAQEQARFAEREREANDRAMAGRDALAEQERLLADQRLQLAQQQRLLAERELALQQRKLADAQEAAAAQLALAAAQQQAVTQQLLAATTAAKAREANEDKQTAGPSRPSEPGPQIHRWVDDEGVVHLSTKPPRSAKR